MRFRATIRLNGKTATGIQVPAEVVASLGPSKRPPVRVTINGHTYRSSVAPMGGEFLLGFSAENRESAGVAAGDEVDVDWFVRQALSAEIGALVPCHQVGSDHADDSSPWGQ